MNRLLSLLGPCRFVVLGLATACATVDSVPPEAAVQSPLAVQTVTEAPGPVATISPLRPEIQQETAINRAPPAASESVARVETPPAKLPAKAVTPPVTPQPRKNAEPVAVAKPPAKAAEPVLDVAGLTARLKETKGIGMLTKLALKNQVDDLLKQFRTHYQSGQKTSVAPLRQPYDMLVLKVLALLEDSDPALARTIAGSREAIWGILADPEKFNAIA